jgi:hypothetical protein
MWLLVLKDTCNCGRRGSICINRRLRMISKVQLFAAAFAGVVVCSSAAAQMRNGAGASAPAVRQPAVHIRQGARASVSSAGTAAAPQTGRQSSVIQISPSGHIAQGFDPIASTVSFDAVPGLGFDYPHLAAISGAQRNNFSPRFGHEGHRGPGTFVPIFFGGYPYYYDDTSYDQPAEQPVQQVQPQPQIIVIQQPIPAQQSADSGSNTGSLSPAASESQPDLPVPDVGNFILVRRDGRILFASLFSVVGTQLQYVTPEGIRRTLAMSDLDADATQQMNEARGTTIQLHN